MKEIVIQYILQGGILGLMGLGFNWLGRRMAANEKRLAERITANDAKTDAIHVLVNNRSEQQDNKISDLTAQLEAKGVLLTAAEKAAGHGET